MDSNLRDTIYNTILDLATDEGINASGKDEVFGCIFGRDSAITILKILKVQKQFPSQELLDICRRGLISLTELQGKKFNIESGEEPGKFIHEFRKDKYERLIQREIPWYVYPDGMLRNYDSIDSTSLALVAIYKYWDLTHDNEFLLKVLPNVEAGLNWQITTSERNQDHFLAYEFPENRKYGGLMVQSWTDSRESLRRPDGTLPKYPIAPVEVQAIGWLALKLWADFYNTQSPKFAKRLSSQAKKIKESFNHRFIIEDNGLKYAAQAIDGDRNRIKTVTANPLVCLWASYKTHDEIESIVDEQYIPDFIKRAFMEDMFEEDAGIRTMSTLSETFNPDENSYHNGSFWPMLNGLITEGLCNFGHTQCADKLKQAALIPIKHFGTPIELYIKKGGTFIEYKSPKGQTSCKTQAWSAAAALDWLTS